jgi:hypothetical protein
MAVSIPMIRITTTSSIKVNPSSLVPRSLRIYPPLSHCGLPEVFDREEQKL